MDKVILKRPPIKHVRRLRTPCHPIDNWKLPACKLGLYSPLMTEPRDICADRDEYLISEIERRVGQGLFDYFGAQVRGVENLPEGAALMVGNHSGGMSTPDSFLLCAEIIRKRGVSEVPFGLAHDSVFLLPGIGPLVKKLGGVHASSDAAHQLFEKGRKVLVYPGGDMEAFRPHRIGHQICFGGRKGYAKLAMAEQVPLVPIVAAGGHSGFLVLGDLLPWIEPTGLTRKFRIKAWPVTLSIPWGLIPGPIPPYLPLPTRILVEVLEPMMPPEDPARLEEFDQQVRSLMQSTLDRLLAERLQLGKIAARDWF